MSEKGEIRIQDLPSAPHKKESESFSGRPLGIRAFAAWRRIRTILARRRSAPIGDGSSVLDTQPKRAEFTFHEPNSRGSRRGGERHVVVVVVDVVPFNEHSSMVLWTLVTDSKSQNLGQRQLYSYRLCPTNDLEQRKLESSGTRDFRLLLSVDVELATRDR